MSPALSNNESLYWFLPELILSGGALLILIWDLIAKRPNRRAYGAGALVILAATAVAIVVTTDGQARGLFGGLVARDPFGDFWKWIALAITGLVGVISMRSKETIDYTAGDKDSGEFYALTLTVCLGLFLMATATDLLTAYIAIEVVSILSFILAGYKQRDRRSSEAALKYAIYGGVASGVMLYGFSLLYGMAGATSFQAIRDAAVVQSSPTTLILGVTLAMAGFGYKIAAVPFHMWCPDVYEGAPTPVTTFLSVGPKAAGFAILIRFFAGALPVELPTAGSLFGSSPWPVLIGVIAVATMTLGNLAALAQTNVKRLLAYSSIAHAGYVLLGLAAGTPEGHEAIMFYLVTYLFMNVGAFVVVIALAEKGFGEDVSSFKGLGFRAPLLGAFMTLFLISLTGLPPTAGFAAKFLVFAAVIQKGGTLLVSIALIGVVNSAISLFYYARILRVMYLERPTDTSELVIDRQHGIVVGAMALPVLLLGLFWSPLQAWAESAYRLWSH